MSLLRLFHLSLAVALGVVLGGPIPTAQEPNVDRRILQRQDLAGVPGHEILVVEATLPVGGREGRHTHPGTMIGYITQGSYALEAGGKLTDYEPGGSVVVNPGQIHEGINRGKVPIKALAIFIVEKGKPLSTMAVIKP
jgi:quercetin dioxygenase-like cupin family protein